ncbi:MAG: DNA adenine methylase [Planctomycetaceae bacterium]|jgi:site-specific DNA-methyltransferase (adenine-specific)|nr:DNA adenine methylase [Planctomycetaceae bacterium]
MKKQLANRVIQTDCLDGCRYLDDESIDLIYLDPPFCSQKEHRSFTRDRQLMYAYSDTWNSLEDYSKYMKDRIMEFHRILHSNGSLFYHCDRRTSHIARNLLDSVFGEKNFRSEIIWYYKRWSNTRQGLLPAHQTIYWYTKTGAYHFFPMYENYSASTNVDQLLQRRIRDSYGKSVYERDKNGQTISLSNKKGVPLSDVWDIPILNPKAKERIGYPSQKPILLLDRIIRMVSESGDWVLDPFCGSGTTLVSAKLNGRNYLGFDISPDAVKLSKQRLAAPQRTDSQLMISGRDSYNQIEQEIITLFQGCNIIPIQRNRGIDAIVKGHFCTGPLTVRVQRSCETLAEAAQALYIASISKQSEKMILVQTHANHELFKSNIPAEIEIVESIAFQIEKLKEKLTKDAASAV